MRAFWSECDIIWAACIVFGIDWRHVSLAYSDKHIEAQNLPHDMWYANIYCRQSSSATLLFRRTCITLTSNILYQYLLIYQAKTHVVEWQKLILISIYY